MSENYIHFRATLSDEPEYEGYSDHWCDPVALKDVETVHFDVTSEDQDEFGLGIPVREVTISGTVTSEQLDALRSEWSLDPDKAEPAMGFLGDLGDGVPRLYDDERHMFAPMDWNVSGMTPVIDSSVSIIGPDAQPA